jgi:hypothetical protein
MKNDEKCIKQKLFESMAIGSRIDLELLNSQDWPVFTSQFDEDPVPAPNNVISTCTYTGVPPDCGSGNGGSGNLIIEEDSDGE